MAGRGTLKLPQSFNAEADADDIQAACKGAGTNEELLNKVLGHRTLQQRMEIREAYNRKYGKDMIEVLHSETSGDYDSLIQMLFRGHLKLLAFELYKSMKPEVLDGIIGCCNNTEIFMLKKAYDEVLKEEDPKKASSRSLISDVKKKCKPPYESLLTNLLNGLREEDPIDKIQEAQRSGDLSKLVNEKKVEEDVKDLYSAGEGSTDKKGNPDEYIQILTSRSKYHIKAIWEMYKRRYGSTLVEGISKKFSDPLKSGLNSVVMAQINLRLLLTCQLQEAMAGLGTREDNLNRIIVLRCENDLALIKDMYRDYFGKSLADAVHSETSGDYRHLLMSLLGEDPNK